MAQANKPSLWEQYLAYKKEQEVLEKKVVRENTAVPPGKKERCSYRLQVLTLNLIPVILRKMEQYDVYLPPQDCE